MAKMIRLTAKMVDALGITIEINGKQGMIMSHPKTQAALADRGLADEFGYLTVAGRYLAYLYGNGSALRTWDIEKLADEGVKWQTGRQKDAGDDPAVECECGAQWPTGVMGTGHNDMNCTTASQRRDTEPSMEEYAQASRAIQSHIPNGRNVLRNSD